ncbi:MAG: cytochrome c-type biogenesis protein CcmH [Candidatus Neomarinimicrobiota bacterium]
MRMKLIMVATLIPLTLLKAENEEAVIRELKQTLMASCFHGTVAEHGDAEMEAEIREMVFQGRTKQEVVDHYMGIYGERILATPIARGFNLMAWFVPLGVFLVGVLVFVNYLKHRSGEPVTEAVIPEREKTPYDDIIERELREME